MPFDVIGFSEATPGTGTVFVAGAALDSLFSVSGDDINLKAAPKRQYLLGVLYAAESTGARALVRQPSLQLDHEFHKCALTPDLDPTQGWAHHFARPLPLVGNEKVNALSVNATDEDTIIGLLVGNAKITQAMLDAVNPTHKITGYGDTTITANSWTQCAITWNQDLPEGTYAVVGMRAGVFLAANAWAALARLLIPGKTEWRPGVPCAVMEADHEEYQSITYEPWVKWPKMSGIQITNKTMPNIEVLSPAAHTDENVELLLEKIA